MLAKHKRMNHQLCKSNKLSGFNEKSPIKRVMVNGSVPQLTCIAPLHSPLITPSTSKNTDNVEKLPVSSTSHPVLKVALDGKKFFTPIAKTITLFQIQKQACNPKGKRYGK
jgi:hypothetical protein